MKSNKPSSFVNEIFRRKTEMPNEILEKHKTHGNKRGLGYINKDETSNLAVSPKNLSLCTHSKKIGHT